MSFVPASGTWTVKRTPTKASTTYTAGAFIANDLTNDVMATVATQQYIRGILVESKTNAAATTPSIGFQCPTSPNCTFYGDMKSGEVLAAANVGAAFDFDSTGLAVSTTTTYKPLTLVRFISTTKGEFELNTTYGIEN